MDNKSYSKAISWVSDCRIPFVDDGYGWKGRIGGFQNVYVGGTCKKHNEDNTQGRFPANILVCDDMLNDGVIGKSGIRKPTGKKPGDYSDLTYSKNMGDPNTIRGFNDKGSNSRYYDIDKWFNNLIE